MEKKFTEALAYVLHNEGSFSNHSADRGGATKYGITHSTLERWRGRKCTVSDVQNLNFVEARQIYLAFYWLPLNLFDAVPGNICTALFDAAVLFGVTTAIREAQTVLIDTGFEIKMDGLLGPITRHCLCEIDSRLFVLGFCQRLGKLIDGITEKNSSQQIFKKGWANRIERMSRLAV